MRNTSGGVTFDLTRLRVADHDRFVNSVLNGKTQMPSWRGVLDMEQNRSGRLFGQRWTADDAPFTVMAAASACSKHEEGACVRRP